MLLADKKRILVLGMCGAGKSTLARALHARLLLPLVHLDQLYWRAGWQHAPKEEWLAALETALKQDAWIMDGNFSATLPRRLQFADAVIWLDYSRLQCLTGVLHRVCSTYGRQRPDLAEGCPERFDLDFLRYVWQFKRTQNPRITAALNAAPQVPVVRLKSRRAAARFLKTLQTKEVLHGSV